MALQSHYNRIADVVNESVLFNDRLSYSGDKVLPSDTDYTTYLTDWKLQLPVNDRNYFSGKETKEILESDIYTYGSEFFKRGNVEYSAATRKTIKCIAPDIGATTSGASNPRTELRGLHNAGGDFLYTDAAYMVVYLRCVNVYPDNLNIIAQIHGVTQPWCVVFWDAGRIRVNIRTIEGQNGTSSNLISPYVPGTIFKLVLEHTATNEINVYVDGSLIRNEQLTQTNDYYFKVGNYYTGSSNIGRITEVEQIIMPDSGVATGVYTP